MGEFEFSPEHPFRPERVKRVYNFCLNRGLFDVQGVEVVDVEEAEDGVLSRFHTEDYLEALRRADDGRSIDVEMLRFGLGTGENPIFKGVYTFAELSATASLEAARRVAEGAQSSFNPCGGFHHAHRDRASGFCYVNDVVIAIDELRSRGFRVAYVDIDAHHGDAVQEAYYERNDVLTISVHETGKTLFPWGGFISEKGKGDGLGFNINVPLEPESDDQVFLLMFESIVMDALELFEPDVIVGQFGTDTLATDPLTHLNLTNNGYIEAIQMLHDRFPRIVALGGGGYNMRDVERCWTLLWMELAGIEPEEGYGGAMGGVFLGEVGLDELNLKDMRSLVTGPVKDRLMKNARKTVDFYKKEISPLLGGTPRSR